MANVPRAPKNHAWLWIFLFLIVASIAVAAVMIWYNLRLQLKPEQLEAARALWKERGPRDYRMVYTTQLRDESHKDRFVVEVRAGRVQSVIMNQTLFLNTREMAYHSMERLYSEIAQSLEKDAKEGRKVYTRANFDGATGALQDYVRRVMGSRERVQIQVIELEQLPAAGD
jgi:hypothetical protein